MLNVGIDQQIEQVRTAIREANAMAPRSPAQFMTHTTRSFKAAGQGCCEGSNTCTHVSPV